MLYRNRVLSICIAAVIAAISLGCQPTPPEQPKKQTKPQARKPIKPFDDDTSVASVKPGDGEGTSKPVRKPKTVDQPPPPTMPKVVLTEQQAQTCLVKVGDVLPDAELPLAPGGSAALRSLLGSKATIVLCWHEGNEIMRELALQSLKDLQQQFVEPYAAKGVRVVTVNVKDPPDAVAKDGAETGVTFPLLVDPKGEWFAKVATEKLPRVYLIDAAGKVLWLELEFSRGTRRTLEQALEIVLGEKRSKPTADEKPADEK